LIGILVIRETLKFECRMLNLFLFSLQHSAFDVL